MVRSSLDKRQLERVPRRLPKLAPDTIERARITKWFVDHVNYPVRLIIAPSGSGKTAAMVSYAMKSAYPCAYLTMPPGADREETLRALCLAFGLDCRPQLHDVLEALEGIGRCEVLIDESDRGAADARRLLHELVVEAPESVTFVYAARSREIVDMTRLVSLGLAALLNAERLAFTNDEAACFAERARAAIANRCEITQLVTDTEGWAFALCSTVRDAVSSGRSLEGAVDRWRASNACIIRDFLEDALAGEPAEMLDPARSAIAGAGVDQAVLERLEARGLFVHCTDGVYHFYRAISGGSSTAPVPAARSLQPFDVRLAGRVDVTLGGRRIKWIRRRDAQLFAFLALQPDGRASRRAIVAAFWPDAHHQLAGQGLRSSCSTLRRAFAEIVGYGNLGHYLSFGDEIALNLDLFAIDVRRIHAHIEDSDAAWERGDVEAAIDHARAALLSSGEVVIDENIPAPLRPAAERFAWDLARARERVAGTAC